MAEAVYILGAASSLHCAVLLFRQWGSPRQRLLWSALSFGGLTVTNIFVFIDLVTLPDLDLHLVRWRITVASLALLLFGLRWEGE